MINTRVMLNNLIKRLSLIKINYKGIIIQNNRYNNNRQEIQDGDNKIIIINKSMDKVIIMGQKFKIL